MVEAKELKFQKGGTCYPIFQVVKWVDKPDSLKEGAAAGIDLVEPTPNTQEPKPAAPTAEELEF